MLPWMFTKLDRFEGWEHAEESGMRCAVWGDLWRDEEELDEDIWRGGGVSRRCGTWLGESEGWWRWGGLCWKPQGGFGCSNLGRRLWRPGWWVPSYDLIDDHTLEMFLTRKKAWSETIHLHFHENKVWVYAFALPVLRSITATSCFDGLDPTGI